MTPKGRNIKVKPKPRETKLASGIIIPNTAKNPSIEEGVVTAISGDIDIEVGSRVWYYGRKCFELDGEKIVPYGKILYYDKQ